MSTDDEQLHRMFRAGGAVRLAVEALLTAGANDLYLSGAVESGAQDAGDPRLRCTITRMSEEEYARELAEMRAEEEAE